jgi:hypothetical protein
MVALTHAERLAQRVEGLRTEASEIRQQAKADGKLPVALKAVEVEGRLLETEGRLRGSLTNGTTINVMSSPEWTALRAALFAALRPYPEASAAVASALAGLPRLSASVHVETMSSDGGDE